MVAHDNCDLYGPWPKLARDRWRPRSPASTLLFEVVREHLDDFLDTVALGHDGHGLPRFVEDELRAFISCGDLRGGFARFQCRACGFERLLPFSCKGRGFCPSCLARRAAERSAHLVDRVIPIVPVRQYVLSLPVPLRYLLAWRHELCLEVLAIFTDELGNYYQRLARDQGIADPATGMVSVIQRFGGSLNLNLHFHLSALDGVFARDAEDKLAFHEAPLPKQQDITVLCSLVRYRVLELLKARDLLHADADLDLFALDEPLLAAISGAAATSRIATGDRAGQFVQRLATLPPQVETRKQPRGAHIDGFDLHAGVALAADDRRALEALLRYQLRPPLAKARLSRAPDGRIKLRLRTPYRDGTTHLLFTPHELLERLAALVPRPNKNLIIYHGCLAPRANNRAEIVAYGRPGSAEPDLPLADFELIDHDHHHRSSSRNHTWAELMARVYGARVLDCPRCTGTLALVALVTAPTAIAAILDHIGLTTGPRKPPPPAPHGQLLLFEPRDLRPQLATITPSRSPPAARHRPSEHDNLPG